MNNPIGLPYKMPYGLVADLPKIPQGDNRGLQIISPLPPATKFQIQKSSYSSNRALQSIIPEFQINPYFYPQSKQIESKFTGRKGYYGMSGILEETFDPIEDKSKPLKVEQPEKNDQDPNFGISQEWLIFQRQGDHYDRLPEWNQKAFKIEAERYNMEGYSTLNDGYEWGPIIITKIPPIKYDEEYKQALEYYQTQLDEETN